MVREGDSHQLYVTDSSTDISNLHKVDVENASPLHRRTANETDETAGAQVFLRSEFNRSRSTVGIGFRYLSHSLRTSQSSRNFAQIMHIEVRLEMVNCNGASDIHGALSALKESK